MTEPTQAEATKPEVTAVVPPAPPAQAPQSAQDNGRKTFLLFLFAGFALLFAVAVAALYLRPTEQPGEQQQNDKPVIGLALANLRTERWQRDRDFILAETEKRGGAVYVTDANDNVELQIEQVESLLLRGVDVLIVVAIDSENEAEVVELAHTYNVPVIAYDRMILDSQLDYYISFDNVEVGRIQAQGIVNELSSGKFAYIGGSENDNNAHLVKQGAMEVLQPLIDSGEIELVMEEFVTDWKQEDAYTLVQNFLANGGELDAVVSANDGMATGVVEALSEAGLTGIPVSGQDAELAACQRIAEGKQTVTAYKPLSRLALGAVDLAFHIINSEVPDINGTVNNGTRDVPAVLISVESVTKDTLQQTVIKDGFHTYEEVYLNVPAAERPAKVEE